MVPEKNRQEWRDLVTGNIEYKCSSFSLQMKINYLYQSYKNNFISIDDAVNDLYTMCVKYEKIYKEDLDSIFSKKLYQHA
jgi:hypothetical protein